MKDIGSSVEKHDSDKELEKEDDGDIVEGGPILYDSTVVDDVPKLPTRDDGNSISIAPGEGKTPISRRTQDLDQLAFPGIFSQGECSFNLEREVPLSLGQYYNSLTWRQDSRCTDSTFIFHAQCQKEKEHLQSTINFQAKKGSVKDMKNDPNVKKLIEQGIPENKVWKNFKQCRTTPGYWDNAKKEVLAMIQQLGPFTWWCTYSADDWNWVTPIKQVAALEGITFTDEQINNMSFQTKVDWINKNPFLVATYINDVYREFVFGFLLKTKVLGEITDYVVKIEFQGRGTPHPHLFLWIKDAPVYGIDSDEKVCAFIDKYVHCSIPSISEDKQLYDLVTRCQVHKCLKSKCKKKQRACKYHFPRFPSQNTIICKGQSSDEYQELPVNIKKEINDMEIKIKTKLIEIGKEFTCLASFLIAINVSQEMYALFLQYAFKEPTVILKRKPNECWINSYNPHTLRLLQSNQDIAFALSMYGCICYLLSYLCKAERNMSKLMKEALLNKQDTADILATVRDTWSHNREMSYPEAVYHLNSLPLFWKSREVVYLATDYPENRIRSLKLHSGEGNENDIFNDGLIEYYQNRPLDQHFENMPLITFAAWYVKKNNTAKEPSCNTVNLLNGKGLMMKKFKKNIIRLPKLNKSDEVDEKERYCFSKLMTYIPWRHERLSDVIKGFKSYAECYEAKRDLIEPLMLEYEKGDSDIKEAFADISKMQPDLEKNLENLQTALDEPEIESVFPLSDDTNESEEEDHHQKSLPTKSCDEDIINSNSNYYAEIRSLNNEQMKIFWYVLEWVRKYNNDPSSPALYLGIIGGAGTGKTKIINVLYQLFERELQNHGDKNVNKVVEKISFTGMAASNIDGKTWHSFLNRGHGKIESLKDISGAAKADGRAKLGSIEVIIEDEISLESTNMDTYMHDYLCYIFEKKENLPYGGKSVIKVGDFMQLKPYGGAPIYPKQNDKETDDKTKPCQGSRAELNNPYVEFNKNRWATYFKCFELSQCMRQKNDLNFAEILRIVRYMTVSANTNLDALPDEQKMVLDFLRSRVMPIDHPNYPHTALHIFPTNKDVDKYNYKMIATVPGAVELKCFESFLDQTGSFKPCDAKKAKDDFGLPQSITIGIGARVMITKNQNVDDKIVNGTLGTVAALTNVKGVDMIWMRPDDSSVGKIKISQLNSKQQKTYPGCIPIVRIEGNISVANDNTTYKRKQFPLKLCYAATIHKYQGRSLDQIVIGGFDSKWMQGMLYTALTRCRKAEGLFLQDFNPQCLKANFDGMKEIERIRKYSLINDKIARLDFFNDYPPDKWNYLCLQNVRSIALHIEDVLCDPIMKSASILCFT